VAWLVGGLQALALYTELGGPEAEQVRARLTRRKALITADRTRPPGGPVNPISKPGPVPAG
jgi:hypothetical protein